VGLSLYSIPRENSATEPRCDKITCYENARRIVPRGRDTFAQVTRPVQEFETSSGTVKITPIQHASVMIQAGGQVIHLDPWSNGNYDGLPPADLILITDIHGDHMDPKMLAHVAKARKPDPGAPSGGRDRQERYRNP
jgi:hypothetical protein